MKSAEERLLEVSSEALDGRPRGLIEFARDALVLLRELVVVVEAGGEGEWVSRVDSWLGGGGDGR